MTDFNFTRSTALVAPSILSADFSRLADEIHAVEAAGADIIHVDVMDGRFVPNLTIGPCVVEKIRKTTRLPIDVHLMIEEPGRFTPDFVKAGADFLSVHVEACPHLHRNIQQIRELSEKHGAAETGRTLKNVVPAVALNPHTNVCTVEEVLIDAGMVLVMTVNPGFGGQKLIKSCLGKIEKIREMIAKYGLQIAVEVDGGINSANAGMATEAGANILVAGAAVFCAKDYSHAISEIKKASVKSLSCKP